MKKFLFVVCVVFAAAVFYQGDVWADKYDRDARKAARIEKKLVKQKAKYDKAVTARNNASSEMHERINKERWGE